MSLGKISELEMGQGREEGWEVRGRWEGVPCGRRRHWNCAEFRSHVRHSHLVHMDCEAFAAGRTRSKMVAML